MALLAFDGVELEIQPTMRDYERRVVPIGTSRRSLNGKLIVLLNGRKYAWRIRGNAGNQRELIESLNSGDVFVFRDFDGREYEVVVVDHIKLDRLGEYSLEIEEV